MFGCKASSNGPAGEDVRRKGPWQFSPGIKHSYNPIQERQVHPSLAQRHWLAGRTQAPGFSPIRMTLLPPWGSDVRMSPLSDLHQPSTIESATSPPRPALSPSLIEQPPVNHIDGRIDYNPARARYHLASTQSRKTQGAGCSIQMSFSYGAVPPVSCTFPKSHPRRRPPKIPRFALLTLLHVESSGMERD